MKNSTTITLIFILLAVFSLAANPMRDSSKYRPVLEALSLMYAPTSEDRPGWSDTVCQRMAVGGCGYFMENHEPLLWQNGQNVTFNSAVPGEVVVTLQDGSQVWKAHVSIHNGCVLEDSPSIESDVYLHVVHDEAQDSWLLNRMLYGPYIKE